MNIMRITFFKNAFASASLVLAVGHTPIALAHIQSGSLGSGAGRPTSTPSPVLRTLAERRSVYVPA